jgi:hypothetical protein
MEIEFGTPFDTPFESGCFAQETPDEFGNFLGLDSDEVICTFNTKMVIGHPDFIRPTIKWMGN